MMILVIRHGQSKADLLGVHEGRADFPLTALGHRQAEALAKHLASAYQLSKIYTSPLKRAQQTAEHLSKKTGLRFETEDLLMEFNNGLIAGLDKKEAALRYPYVPDLPLHTALYQQESRLNFQYRAELVLSKIIAENGENTVLALVSHGGMINRLYHAFLRLPLESKISIITGDTGIHAWQIDQGVRKIHYANRIMHLEDV